MSGGKLTVSELNRYIKNKFAGDPNLQNFQLIGELSNVKFHRASGHWYLTLKDDQAAVNAVMFRSKATQLNFQPENGQEVLVLGSAAVYEKSGTYQVYIDKMIEVGQGSLQKRFEALKALLLKEGVLKRPEMRRPLPKFPRNIALVTSPTGAVIRDMVTTIRRRCPQVNLLLVPANVQGAFAADSIVATLDKVYAMDDIDLIICGRGGGSLEDLWCFNEEKVVRRIAASPIPIISAVGHETDVTLADFAADKRAGTPSNAAEIAVPDMNELARQLKRNELQLEQALVRLLNNKKEALSKLMAQPVFQDPMRFLAPYMMQLDQRLSDFEHLGERFLQEKKFQLAKRAETLQALNPLAILARGYGLCHDRQGHVLTSVARIEVGTELCVALQDGEVISTVNEIRERT